MNLFIQLFGALTQDHQFGGGGSSLERINAPSKPSHISPDRARLFKQYNHAFRHLS